MKESQLTIKTHPWHTPNCVRLHVPHASASSLDEAPTMALEHVPAETLSDMCDNYRAEVFEKAGKDDPGGDEVDRLQNEIARMREGAENDLKGMPKDTSSPRTHLEGYVDALHDCQLAIARALKQEDDQ